MEYQLTEEELIQIIREAWSDGYMSCDAEDRGFDGNKSAEQYIEEENLPYKYLK